MKNKKFLIIGIVILFLLIALPFISLALLNSDWLKDKLVERASTNLNADLRVESLTFTPFKGKALLSGIEFSRKDEKADLDMTLESAELEVNIRPLLYRSVQIRRLELIKPQITSVVRRPEVPKKERPSDEEGSKKKRAEVELAQLLIQDGVIDVTTVREGHEPFKARITDIDYSAENVSMESLLKLLHGADLHCNIEMGTNAILDKMGTSKPSTFSLKGVDLGYASKFFDSRKEREFVVTDGMMDMDYAIGEDLKTRVKVGLKGLKLASNPDASDGKFMFIPVDRIINRVEKNAGDVTLEFVLDEDVTVSDDLEFIVKEFWKGLWIAILEKVSPGSIDDLVEEGKQKILEGDKKELLEEGKKKALDFLQRRKKEE